MSEIPIPEDLKEDYEVAKYSQDASDSKVFTLIERIARLEAENAELKQRLVDQRKEHQAEDGKEDHGGTDSTAD